MIREAIFKIVDKQDLTYDEAFEVVTEIMTGQTTAVQTAAFLAALSTKSTKAETIDEIAGCAEAMRSIATKLEYSQPVLEIVGTGGDRAGSFNISTTASMVIAAGGVKVAKHGNRAASSKSGAADCLEAMGIEINQEPALCEKLLDENNICFLFAQKYHAAMKYVGPIRKELGIRTVFNILGPLTNPATPTYFVMGVYDRSLVEPLARVLSSLGVKHGVVVYGEACLDELSSACKTYVCEVQDGQYSTYTVDPADYGMPLCTREDLVGGTPEENAQITRDILTGKDTGCRRDTVVLNAAAGLYVGGAAASFAEGVDMARRLIEDGSAAKVMENYIALSNEGAKDAVE